MEVSSDCRPNGRLKIGSTSEAEVRKKKEHRGPPRREATQVFRLITRGRPLGQVCSRVRAILTRSPVPTQAVLGLSHCVSPRLRTTTEKVENFSLTMPISLIEAI